MLVALYDADWLSSESAMHSVHNPAKNRSVVSTLNPGDTILSSPSGRAMSYICPQRVHLKWLCGN